MLLLVVIAYLICGLDCFVVNKRLIYSGVERFCDRWIPDNTWQLFGYIAIVVVVWPFLDCMEAYD